MSLYHVGSIAARGEVGPVSPAAPALSPRDFRCFEKVTSLLSVRKPGLTGHRNPINRCFHHHEPRIRSRIL
jgi:hypothetical protein